jgi:hypothetical protein
MDYNEEGVRHFQQTSLCAAALKLIRPSDAKRRVCLLEIYHAVCRVEHGMRRDQQGGDTLLSVIEPGSTRRQFERIAKKLRALEIESENVLGRDFLKWSKIKREAFESLLAGSAKLSRPGSPRKSFARTQAAFRAHALLARHGSRRPGLTVSGVWHQLANILFEAAGGAADADLFGYLRDYHKGRSARDAAMRRRDG